MRPIAPFRLDLTAWALRRRSRNAIDRWDGTTYRRTIIVGGRMTELAICQTSAGATPRLSITATPLLRTTSDRRAVRLIVDQLLGTRIDLREWYRLAERDPRLRSLAARFRGVKPPRFPTLFEAVVNGFACQQLSLVVGLELLNRLAVLCNVRRKTDGHVGYAFPPPRDIARLSPSAVQSIGFSRQKVRALLALARGIVRGTIDLAAFSDEENDTVRSRLLALRGVGRWTAEYVLLRGLGRLDVFPGDDVGAQNSLARWLRCPNGLDYAGVMRAVAKWRPYAGMVYFHLLLDGLSQAGEVIE